MRRGNGDGSIIKLGGKRRRPYAVRVTVGWTDDGKQIYKYIGYYTGKREANAALRAYQVNPYDLTVTKTKLKEIFDAWLKNTKLKPVTIRGYKSAFNQAYNIHNLKIRDVNMSDLDNAMFNLKPSMQASFKNAMLHVYKYAIKNNMIEKNLAEFLEPQQPERKRRKPFTVEQIEQIKRFNHKYTDIVIILLYSGMRINELLGMKKENVDLEQRFMVGGLKTRAGINRVIPIHKEIYDIIERYYHNSNKYLIEHNGRPVVYRTFMTVFWERLKEYLNTDQTPHCTRHTFVSAADNCGFDKVILKKIVGHETGSITDDIYNHKHINDLITEINKLEYK